MPPQKLETKQLLGLYNPWWENGLEALANLPEFERPVLAALTKDCNTQPQILSITGPRRVGKTTLLRQLVRHFIKHGREPEQIVYYSLDDPTLLRPGLHRGRLIETLMVELRKRAGRQKVLLLLDEVQRLDQWELYLKKYYDLNFPIRFVISGSASSPIFKKS
jgi:predicted AAA+ superfamily ATPase